MKIDRMWNSTALPGADGAAGERIRVYTFFMTTTRISSGSPFEPAIGFSREVHFGDRVPVHGELFAEVRPAATMVLVAGLLDTRRVVEIEAKANLSGRGSSARHEG